MEFTMPQVYFCDPVKYKKLQERTNESIAEIITRNINAKKNNISCQGLEETNYSKIKREIPVYRKDNLTLEEASVYFNIGINKLRSMTDERNCNFVLWNGTKRLIKRRILQEYLDKAYSI